MTLTEVVNDTSLLHCKCGIDMIIREQVIQDDQGRIVRYKLTFIHYLLCRTDNGRVLGYENVRGYHHRHFMGSVECVEFISYEALLSRFLAEVKALRRNHEQGCRGHGF